MKCSECNKSIRFWQKKLNYTLAFDFETGKETTVKMHTSCSFNAKYRECFGVERLGRMTPPSMEDLS